MSYELSDKLDTKDLNFIYKADDVLITRQFNEFEDMYIYEITPIHYDDTEHAWTEHTFWVKESDLPSKVYKLAQSVIKRNKETSNGHQTVI